MNQHKKYPNTAAALEEWSKGLEQRQAAWDAAHDLFTVKQAAAADQAALELVQNAYYQDTQLTNSLYHCKLMDIRDLRRMVNGGP